MNWWGSLNMGDVVFMFRSTKRGVSQFLAWHNGTVFLPCPHVHELGLSCMAIHCSRLYKRIRRLHLELFKVFLSLT